MVCCFGWVAQGTGDVYGSSYHCGGAGYWRCLRFLLSLWWSRVLEMFTVPLIWWRRVLEMFTVPLITVVAQGTGDVYGSSYHCGGAGYWRCLRFLLSLWWRRVLEMFTVPLITVVAQGTGDVYSSSYHFGGAGYWRCLRFLLSLISGSPGGPQVRRPPGGLSTRGSILTLPCGNACLTK